jgi:cupin 2 domain-containing protein
VGEDVVRLVAEERVVIEHIASGLTPEPVAFVQLEDEWVVVLEGAADLELDGEVLGLSAGDWLLIPGSTPHRLLRTDPGTRWLAVHVRRG